MGTDFTWFDSDRTRKNCLLLQEKRFMLHVRSKLFTQRTIRHMDRLPFYDSVTRFPSLITITLKNA